VNRPAPHSALRKIRTHLTRPVTLAALASAIAVLALAGPFGTWQSLTPLPRLGYWAAIVLATYATGTAIDVVLSQRLPRVPLPATMAVIALTTGVAVTLVVAGLNALLLDGRLSWAILGQILAVAVIATLALQIVGAQAQADPPAGATDKIATLPALLDRMPPDKRGKLVALSAEDHYVRVRTTRGDALVLLRLSDAIREAAPTPGLRVHRSHWVARDAITGVRREGDRGRISLIAGGDIPASRAHIPSLKRAGLLPPGQGT